MEEWAHRAKQAKSEAFVDRAEDVDEKPCPKVVAASKSKAKQIEHSTPPRS